MLFELRTYDLKPGKAPVYLEYFRTFGLSRVTSHLPMMGYWMVETGRLNRIEHMWAYESMAERDEARRGLEAETEWMEVFIPKAFKDVVAQENRFLRLDESTDDFDAAIQGRKSHHADQGPDTPMFAREMMSLTIGKDVISQAEKVAAFTVLSGDRPGSRVTLAKGPSDVLLAGAEGADTHEILRPLSLSPLK